MVFISLDTLITLLKVISFIYEHSLSPQPPWSQSPPSPVLPAAPPADGAESRVAGMAQGAGAASSVSQHHQNRKEAEGSDVLAGLAGRRWHRLGCVRSPGAPRIFPPPTSSSHGFSDRVTASQTFRGMRIHSRTFAAGGNQSISTVKCRLCCWISQSLDGGTVTLSDGETAARPKAV